MGGYVFCPHKKITSRLIRIRSIFTVIFIWSRRTKLMVLEKGLYGGYPATKVLMAILLIF
jgi:hypothetical protein